MSQTKAQLVAPIGIVTASGVVASGVVTATTFDGNITGTATSIKQGANLNVGIMSATVFAGDFTGTATGITTGSDIKVGAFTASSFTGDFTGTATSMMRGTGFEAGAVNATGFVANVVGDVTGNTTGLAGSVTSGGNIHVGVMTATSYSGDGSNLTGIAATNFNTQTVTANASETIIDLAAGNMITMNQSANTTVGFASTSTSMAITLIRIKDATTTERTITWPSSIRWNGGSAPTLVDSNPTGEEFDQIALMTRDEGVTWYGWVDATNNRVDNTFWSWGQNTYGALGQNNTTSYSSPTQVPGTTWSGEGGTNDESPNCMLTTKTDGTLWGWGSNDRGVLGQNQAPSVQYSSPVQVGTDTTWALIALYKFSPWVTKSDGTMWVWGYNDYGVLGLNSDADAGTTAYSSPVQLPGTTWPISGENKIMSGQSLSGAIKTDGTLWMCGNDADGQLGLNDEVNRSSPTQIPGTTWSTIVDANGNVMSTKTDGTLWSWGQNTYGQLGHNNRTSYSSPMQIGTDTTWSYICSATQSSYPQAYAVKTDGTLWTWGYNEDGQLGLNNTAQYSSPTQVGTQTTWSKVAANKGSTWALKTDGTLWSWGKNTYGMLGHNNAHPAGVVSSPTQIPGTNWTKLLRMRGSSVGATQQA